jgi:hypothetical protein
LAILLDLVNPNVPDTNFSETHFSNGNFFAQLRKGIELLGIESDQYKYGKKKFDRSLLRNAVIAKYQSATGGNAPASSVPAAPAVAPEPAPAPAPAAARFTPVAAVPAIANFGAITPDQQSVTMADQLAQLLRMVTTLQTTVDEVRLQNEALVKTVAGILTANGSLNLAQLKGITIDFQRT